MKVDLKKLAKDLRHDDVDMLQLTLSTLARLDLAKGSHPRSSLEALRDALLPLAGRSDEIGAMARPLSEDVSQNPALLEEEFEVAEGGGDGAPFSPPSLEEFLDKGDEERQEFWSWMPHASPEEQASWLQNFLRRAGEDFSLFSRFDLIRSAQLAGRLERSEAVDWLECLAGAPWGEVRGARLAALARLVDEPDLFLAVLPHLKDPDPDAREVAVQCLRRLDPDLVLGTLERMVESGSTEAKALSLYALRWLPGEKSEDLLRRLARDESEDIRRRTAEALEGHEPHRAVPLLKLLVNDLDIDVAEKALGLYERMCKELDQQPFASSRPRPSQVETATMLAVTTPQKIPSTPIAKPVPPKPAAPAAAKISLPTGDKAPIETSFELVVDVSEMAVTEVPEEFVDVPTGGLDFGDADSESDFGFEPDLEPTKVSSEPIEESPPAPEPTSSLSDSVASTPPLPEAPKEAPNSGSVEADPEESSPSQAPIPGESASKDEDEGYPKIDEALIRLGHRAYESYLKGRVTEPSFQGRCKQLVAALAKSPAPSLFDRILRRPGPGAAEVSEAFRSFGEWLMDQKLGDEFRLAELDSSYRRVEGLLENLRSSP